jgi:crossover junction endodeoxyribonuclease RuvC
MKSLGIDPGITGACAIFNDGVWIIIDMPVAGDKRHHEINVAELLRWLREHQPDHAFIEFASSRPHQGVSSTFRYGAAYGAVKAVCAAIAIPITIVTPQRWKKFAGIAPGADKEADRLRALQLFPDQAAQLSRKRDHARSDAMMLAWFGAKLNGGAGA